MGFNLLFNEEFNFLIAIVEGCIRKITIKTSDLVFYVFLNLFH